MKPLFLMLVLCLTATPLTAQAQPDFLPAVPGRSGTVQLNGTAGEIGTERQCFRVRNTAPYKVHGNFATDYFTRPDGIRARHRSNFALEPGEHSDFCTNGPYFEGGKLELTLRSLIPLFSCKTRVDGEIVINGRRKDEGGTDTWAICR